MENVLEHLGAEHGIVARVGAGKHATVVEKVGRSDLTRKRRVDVEPRVFFRWHEGAVRFATAPYVEHLAGQFGKERRQFLEQSAPRKVKRID